jgi:hypothetical protein
MGVVGGKDRVRVDKELDEAGQSVFDVRVVRCRLRTQEESLVFWHEQGPFRYAVQGCYDKNVYPDVLLDSEEWIFADKLKALVKELLQWETRQLHAEWVFPTEEEYNDPVFGEFMVAGWEIINLMVTPIWRWRCARPPVG